MKYLKILGWIWALPVSILGLLLFIVCAGRPYKFRPAGVWQWVSYGGLSKWYFNKYNMAAMTVGCMTIFSPDYVEDLVLIRHEREHTYQVMILGVLFIVLYYGDCLFLYLTGKNPYLDNFFEKQAYAIQDDINS